MTSRIQYNSPASVGALALPYHYEMVSDRRRLTAFKTAFEQLCPGRFVVESGSGSGILALLARQAGARRVFSVDVDRRAVALARANLERSGLDNVEFHHMSSLALSPALLGDERPDILIAENMSTWLVTEPQVAVMNHLSAALSTAKTIPIPTRIDNRLCLARATYDFEDLVEVRTHFFEFTGVPRAEAMSEVQTFERLDMRAVDNPTYVRNSLRIQATRAGVVNALRLTSPLELCPGVAFAGSDSLMPPVVVPLAEALEVDEGDWVELDIEFARVSDWDDFYCAATLAAEREPRP